MCPYRLHWSFHCMHPTPTTHIFLLCSFELRIPSSCNVPRGKSSRQPSALLRSTTRSFRKWVSIWSFSRSNCVYPIYLTLKKGRNSLKYTWWQKGRERKEAMEGQNESPVVADSEPGWKVESWLWSRTPMLLKEVQSQEPTYTARAGAVRKEGVLWQWSHSAQKWYAWADTPKISLVYFFHLFF